MELKQVADIATALAALVAVIALIVGLWQFNKTQLITRENLRLQAETLQHEREVKAIELLLNFNNLKQVLTSRHCPGLLASE